MTPQQASNLSDSALDVAYAKAYDTKNVQDATTIELEILDRLQSVGAFVSGIFGFKRFPLYDVRGRFQQTVVAQESTKESAANVGGAIVGSVSGAFWKIAVPAVIILAVFLYFKKKAGL